MESFATVFEYVTFVQVDTDVAQEYLDGCL